MKTEALISGLKKQNPTIQKHLYDHYSKRWYGVCLRYMKNEIEAEDVMIQGFVKIFKEIKKYKSTGSFESWMYKIMVNESLMEIRKSKNFNLRLELYDNYTPIEPTVLNELYEKDLLEIIKKLPMGCGTIFNLFCVEGYSHKEIAEKLNISIGTSKSQLNLAKQKIKALLPKDIKEKYNGTRK